KPARSSAFELSSTNAPASQRLGWCPGALGVLERVLRVLRAVPNTSLQPNTSLRVTRYRRLRASLRRLPSRHPVTARVPFQQLEQILRLEWLFEHRHHTGSTVEIFNSSVRGHQNDPEPVMIGSRTQRIEERQPIHSRHSQIEQHQVG